MHIRFFHTISNIRFIPECLVCITCYEISKVILIVLGFGHWLYVWSPEKGYLLKLYKLTFGHF